MLYGFALLQAFPILEGNSLFACYNGIELTGTGQGETVAVAGNAVVNGKGLNVTLLEEHGFGLGCQLAHLYLEGKEGGNTAQAVDHALGAHWPHD